MVKLSRFMSIAAVGLFICFCYVDARSEVVPVNTALKQKYDKCISGFNIDAIDLSNPKLKNKSGLLRNYFMCKAARSNSVSVCDKLPLEFAQMCRKYYQEYVDFIGMGLSKGPTSRGVERCMAFLGDKAKCEDFLRGLNRKDSSACGKVQGTQKEECEAQILGKAGLCSSPACKQKADFVNAVRSRSMAKCNSLGNEMVVSICKAYIGTLESVCQDEPGYTAFKEIYCQDAQ